MAFFQKLKERLFKSSSKLGDGLETIIESAPEAVVTPPAAPVPATADEGGAQPGLVGRLLGAERGRVLDDAMLESLEELLIASDMGVDTSLKVAARLAEGRFGRRVGTREIREALAAEIATILEPVARPMPIYPKRPQVVLVVGVNGSGKTTTIG
jgi:fused signal recognition particle receptor